MTASRWVRRALSAGAASLALASLIGGAGCSTRVEDEDSADPGKLTPSQAPTFFDQAVTCRNLFAARAGFRDIDLAEGVLRWSCGDVNGVTAPDLGQEYCEFHAILNGDVVDGAQVSLDGDDSVECLFSSVFADAATTQAAIEAATKKHTDASGTVNQAAVKAELAQVQDAYEAKIASQVAPLLKNAASIPPNASTMQVGFNTRGAATKLIEDCAALAPQDSTPVEHGVACADALLDRAAPEAQKTACAKYVATDRARAQAQSDAGANQQIVIQSYQAAVQAGMTQPAEPSFENILPACLASVEAAPAETKAQLQAACDDLQRTLADMQKAAAAVEPLLARTEQAWTAAAAAGVAFKANDDYQRDIAACSSVGLAQGLGWRNSDPSICARTYRAARCGYEFAPVPDAMVGFELRGWTNRDALPVGCRYLQIEGGTPEKPFRDVVACTASRADVDDYTRARKPLQSMCRDRFGVNLALQVPLRAIATKKDPFEGLLRGVTPSGGLPVINELPSFCSAFGGESAAPAGGAK